MNNHVVEWLGAYLDGELSSERRQKVEQHLHECAACRSEFEDLQQVSDLLHRAPAPQFTPADKFAAQLALQMPRHIQNGHKTGKSSPVWWLPPMILLGGWLFIQTVLWLSGIVSLLDTTRLLGSAAQWFSDETAHTVWFTAAMSLFGSSLNGVQQSALTIADQWSTFSAGIFGQILWQTVVALLYTAWLVAWWVRRWSPQAKMTAV